MPYGDAFPVGVNATVVFDSNAVEGFLCVTSGAITITKTGNGAGTVLNAFPVTAGSWFKLPFFLSTEGGSIIASGGASGTLVTS